MRISLVFVKAIRNNWKSTSQSIYLEEDIEETMPRRGSQQFKFLNKTLLAPDGSKEEGEVGISNVEDAKEVLRLFRIWVTCLVYAVVYAQVLPFLPNKESQWTDHLHQVLKYLLLHYNLSLAFQLSLFPSMIASGSHC